jgi:RNA polymerase-interacting CarD/CdnL/TRCF family regulator
MSFQIDQRVVYPAFGLGRITRRVTKSFYDADMQEFYEVVGEHSTVWVQVSEAAARGLRPLTRTGALPHFRAVLLSRPVILSTDARQRHRDMAVRLKRGTFQDLCEVVRDLTAHGWQTPLSEYDVLGLKKSLHWLCQEWAAADEVSLTQAMAEVNALLREARRVYLA